MSKVINLDEYRSPCAELEAKIIKLILDEAPEMSVATTIGVLDLAKDTLKKMMEDME